jgi:protein-S-isoprenylcysteine O-methyltransferase Ste14
MAFYIAMIAWAIFHGRIAANDRDRIKEPWQIVFVNIVLLVTTAVIAMGAAGIATGVWQMVSESA